MNTANLTEFIPPESVHNDAVAALRLVAAHQTGDQTLITSLQTPPSLIVFAAITAVLSVIVYAVGELSNYQEIRANWPTYRCHPSITPFSTFYGFDLKETMRFCIGQSVKEFAPGVIDPLFKAINEITQGVEKVFDKVEAIGGGVETLLSKFKQFVVDFMNSFRLVGVQVRMSVIRINEIFQRIYAMFIAFAYAAISALTFGENMVCNPLVAFIGDIAGVDVCCFAPETQIPLADGRRIPIQEVRIGDRLAMSIKDSLNENEVTSVFQFDGKGVDMVRIHGIHVSSNHAVWNTRDTAWTPANKHPDAAPAPSIPRLWCLNTTRNEIPTQSSKGSLLFTDYEESSDPAVVAAAQRVSEEAANGWAWIAGPTVEDYSLGLDPTFHVVLANGRRVALAEVCIGDVLNTGAQVEGCVSERCSELCRVPGSGSGSGSKPPVVSAAQMVFWNNKWDRAERVWPSHTPLDPDGDPILIQLLTGGTPFMVEGHDGTQYPVRDYVEWVGAQSVYDAALGLNSSSPSPSVHVDLRPHQPL